MKATERNWAQIERNFNTGAKWAQLNATERKKSAKWAQFQLWAQIERNWAQIYDGELRSLCAQSAKRAQKERNWAQNERNSSATERNWAQIERNSSATERNWAQIWPDFSLR